MANGYTENAIEGRNLSVTCPLHLWRTYSSIFPWTKPDLLFRYDGHILCIPNIEREDSDQGHTHVIQRSPVDPGFRNPYRPNVLRQ